MSLSPKYPVPRRLRKGRVLAAVLVGLALFLGAAVAATSLASAMTDEELISKKEHWQKKYRTLLINRARLASDVAGLEHDYAQAQRRNYPRGGARERLRTQAAETRIQLEGIEQQIEGIFAEARADDVPPGWLYEVEDEPLDVSQPASPEPAASDEDREGRNPRFFEKDEEDEDS